MRHNQSLISICNKYVVSVFIGTLFMCQIILINLENEFATPTYLASVAPKV